MAYLQQRWDLAASAFEQATGSDSRNVSDDFFLGATYVKQKRGPQAVACFERVVASPIGLPDELMRKYVPGAIEIQLPITDRVTVQVGLNSVGAALILAELYQELGRRSEAIGLIQRLLAIAPDDLPLKLSLADLLYEDDDFQGLVNTSKGVENRDDMSLAILHLKAKALANQGMLGPATDLLSDCLKRTSGRDAELLKEIRYNRAEAYELLGERRKAKSDWTKLAAVDPFYRDVKERLEATP